MLIIMKPVFSEDLPGQVLQPGVYPGFASLTLYLVSQCWKIPR